MDAETKEMMKEMATVRCAFCKGTGKDPFSLLSSLATCEVCMGKGETAVQEPFQPCVYCKGSGIQPHSRLTCTVCGGKGVIHFEKPVRVCPDCGGSGREESDLPCVTCKGKGLIPKEQESGG